MGVASSAVDIAVLGELGTPRAALVPPPVWAGVGVIVSRSLEPKWLRNIGAGSDGAAINQPITYRRSKKTSRSRGLSAI